MRQRIKSLLKRAAGVSALEREIQSLRQIIGEVKKSVKVDPSYDLVRLDNVSLFVPTSDNLYDRFIPSVYKGFLLDRHNQLLKTENAPSMADLDRDITKLMLLYIALISSNRKKIHLLDMGAWVGDFALRLAKFAKLRNIDFYAECYDPSLAGSLIPFNIELNKLGDSVAFHPIGISLTGDPQVFCQLRGNSDASRLSATASDHPDLQSDTYLIKTTTLEDCLPKDDAHVIVKLDVEGIDAQVVLQCFEELTHATLVIELAPAQAQYQTIDPENFLRRLLETHSLFDVCYLPRPTRAAAVTMEQVSDFIDNVRRRDFGYTDVLAVPRSLPNHDEIAQRLGQIPSVPASYMMA